MTDEKFGFEEALANMATASSSYHKEYVFYAHLISQCRVTYDPKLGVTEEDPEGTPCDVNFMHDHYNLFINPTLFNQMPLTHRMGTLKHNMLHILYDHVTRLEGRDVKKFQKATDCAINQHINADHLPDDAVTPKNLLGNYPVSENKTAEQYFEMLPDEDDNNNDNDDDGGSGSSTGDHQQWAESQGEEVIQQDLTKKMMEQANAETQKVQGNTPSQYTDWLDIFNNDKQVNWKQVLRRIVGNRRANQRKTLLRRDRRSPHFEHIKGRTKDRTFDLLVVGDESGSVSDTELVQAISETIQLCKVMNTSTRYISVDTQAYPSVELKANTRSFERNARGGTYISKALKQASKEHLSYDALLVITDGYLHTSDVEAFAEANRPTIFLITSEGQIMDQMQTGRMRAIKLETGD
jgi:predicted metal-dependent peptidase